MITEAKGNLLNAPVEALVNTVNTEGVMGKGIALQFKNAFPAMFKDYAAAARRGEIRLGQMHVWPTQALTGPQYVVNFPTKGHWRSNSRLADIDSGLDALVRVVRALDIKSIAIPPLGCGNGGLRWDEVRPRIRQAFANLPDVDVQVYPPAGAPSAEDMVVNSEKPKISTGRAALIEVLDRYGRQALDVPSLIETQKLMYFLQLAGEPLRLNFEPKQYGPYADALRHVLKAVEGHYISGFGDGSAKVTDAAPLHVMSGAVEQAESVLAKHPDSRRRIDRVMVLAEGFETAYGMELLATVHWVAKHEVDCESPLSVAENVAKWSPRKARMFTPEHVGVALQTLQSRGWLTNA